MIIRQGQFIEKPRSLQCDYRTDIRDADTTLNCTLGQTNSRYMVLTASKQRRGIPQGPNFKI